MGKQRLVQVDGAVRLDPKYPVGIMDVLEMPKAKETFRVLYDVKGRFTLHSIPAESANYKLLKVTKAACAVPVAVRHDGRTLRYPDPLIAAGDTVKFNLKEKKVEDFIKFKEGVTVMVTGGANTGRVGKVMDVERHPGSFDIVHVKDAYDNTFATRKTNVFIIGRSDEADIELPKAKGVRIPLEQDRELRIATIAKQRAGKAKRN